MTDKENTQQISRDDVLRRMLNTPPTAHKPIGKRKVSDPDANPESTEPDIGDPKDRGGAKSE